MSYQQKKAIVSISTGLLLLAAYCFTAFGKVRAGLAAPDDLTFWATTMLVFVGIGIAATIVIQIIFHILLSVSVAVKVKIERRDCEDGKLDSMIAREMVEDEMDKLIELKSSRVGFGFAGAGFLAGLICLVSGLSAAVLLNILYGAFSLGTIAEGFAQLYYYKRGLRHGQKI